MILIHDIYVDKQFHLIVSVVVYDAIEFYDIPNRIMKYVFYPIGKEKKDLHLDQVLDRQFDFQHLYVFVLFLRLSFELLIVAYIH